MVLTPTKIVSDAQTHPAAYALMTTHIATPAQQVTTKIAVSVKNAILTVLIVTTHPYAQSANFMQQAQTHLANAHAKSITAKT
jgi:hypothetical protein